MNPLADDNIAAEQLEGHHGTLIECTTCHAPGSLGLTLNGRHGMHPVGDPNRNEEHEDLAERDEDKCRACHGINGEGTVLSRMAKTRTPHCDDEDLPGCNSNETITLAAGTSVGCGLCHGTSWARRASCVSPTYAARGRGRDSRALVTNGGV